MTLPPDNNRLLLYAWGDNSNGQLGIEQQPVKIAGSTNEYLSEATAVDFFNNAAKTPDENDELEIESIACGYAHTLFLSRNGAVFACGSATINDASTKLPKLVELLSGYKIVAVAAGSGHSLALADNGQLFSWGSPKNNVLGRDHEIKENGIIVDYTNHYPRLIKVLAQEFVIQIATFSEHCLVLTDQGKLFAWGANEFGQCGVGHQEPVRLPTLIESLSGVPIARIACGATHSAMLTKSAGFWAWGDNRSGQLGKFDLGKLSTYPVNVRAVRQQNIVHVACGEGSTYLLSLDGKVLSFGTNAYGQTGHGKTNPEQPAPRQIQDLMGTTICQVVAGRRHAHVAKIAAPNGVNKNNVSARVYSMGCNSNGQCGTTTAANVFQIEPVLIPKTNNESVLHVREVFAGGNHSFMLLSRACDSSNSAVDLRHLSDTTTHRRFRPILCIDRHFLNDCLEYGRRDDSSCITNKNECAGTCFAKVEKIFTSLACLNASLLNEADHAHFGCTKTNSGVTDISRCREYATKLLATRYSDTIRHEIAHNIYALKTLDNPADVEAMRIMLLLPVLLCPSTQVVSLDFIRQYLLPFIRISIALQPSPERIFESWLNMLKPDEFLFYVRLWRNCISYVLEQPNLQQIMNDEVEQMLRAIFDELAFLFHISQLRGSKNKVSLQEFYIPIVALKVNLAQDYLTWVRSMHHGVERVQRAAPPPHHSSADSFSPTRQLVFCNYPFIFDGSAKVMLLKTDAKIQQHQAAAQGMQVSAFQAIFQGTNIISPEHQFLNIIVNRRDLVMQSLLQVSQASELDLKKPLRVKFMGEEAEDAGGVRKEFFILLMRELLDPKYGMFVEDEESRTLWFNPASFEGEDMFFLVGACCGLAIYNDVIFYVNFPLPLYSKLLDQPVGLNDLAYLSPMLHRSLNEVLDYDGGDFEDVFSLTFAVTQDRFGVTETVELCPDGAKKAVTLQNKQEYVRLHADFVLNKSVEKQYAGFHRGFHKVVSGQKIFRLLQPDELMSLVCGSEQYDWHELEKNTQYKGGVYSNDHYIIRWFWEVFHNDLDVEQRKRFLLYLTGSDRVPLQGMRHIVIVIQSVKDDAYLPVAHTCFNLLDLPMYKTKEVLRQKLVYAIEHSSGFALV